jgi:hypothetical protein
MEPDEANVTSVDGKSSTTKCGSVKGSMIQPMYNLGLRDSLAS